MSEPTLKLSVKACLYIVWHVKMSVIHAHIHPYTVTGHLTSYTDDLTTHPQVISGQASNSETTSAHFVGGRPGSRVVSVPSYSLFLIRWLQLFVLSGADARPMSAPLVKMCG